jgi:hypothetical protein
MKKTFLFTIGMVLVGTLLTGCLQSLTRTSGDSVADVEILQTLQRQFEDRNVSGILENVHSSYDDGTGNRNDLRYQLSQVFDQYSQIDLEFYGQRKTSSDNSIVITAYWNLRWTCTDSGSGCSSSGEVVLRKGSTTFVFKQGSEDSDQLKLISQRSGRLFGNVQPGRVHR